MICKTRLLELSKFQSISSLQEEIAKKFYRFQIREEGTKLNSALQNAIGYALARLLDTTPRDNDDVPKLMMKQVLAYVVAPICRLIDEGMLKECAMLSQAEAKGKVPFANRNGKPDISDGSDAQVLSLRRN